MAKSITINTGHEYKGETVAEALAWVEKNTGGEDEEGNDTGPAYSPADLIIYGVRRLRALHKDGKRHASGKLASTLYAPRLDALTKDAPRKLATLVETIHQVGEKLAPAKERKS